MFIFSTVTETFAEYSKLAQIWTNYRTCSLQHSQNINQSQKNSWLFLDYMNIQYNLCLLSCRNIHQLQEQILWGNIPFNNKMEQNRTKQKTTHSSWPWESYVFFLLFFFLLYTIKRSLMVVNAQSWMRHNTLWLPSTSNNQRTDIQHLNRHNFILCRLIQEGVRRHTDSALGVIFTQLYHWLDEWMV